MGFPLESIVDTTPLHGGRCVSSFVWSCWMTWLFAGLPFGGRSVERFCIYLLGICIPLFVFNRSL